LIKHLVARDGALSVKMDERPAFVANDDVGESVAIEVSGHDLGADT
jgi:hypothetical protein